MRDNLETSLGSNLQSVAPAMTPILPLWEYCCLTDALLAAVASMAELDLPGGVWRGEPLDREAETGGHQHSHNRYWGKAPASRKYIVA